MKTLTLIAFTLFSLSSFARIDCIGTTIEFIDDGTATSEATVLKKIEGDKNYSVYFGESGVFKFYADHDEEKKIVSLEVLDKKDTLVVNNPRVAMARFNVSIAGYWKTYFTSLNCSPE